MPIKKRKLIKDQDVSEMDDNEFLEMLRKFNERADKELKEYHCMVCMGYAIQSQEHNHWVDCMECGCTYPIQ